jgi:hypothetical protein
MAADLVEWLDIVSEMKEVSCCDVGWININDAKNEFYSRVDSSYVEANIVNCNVGTSDEIVDGNGYSPTRGYTL